MKEYLGYLERAFLLEMRRAWFTKEDEKMKDKAINPTEHQIQVSIVDWSSRVKIPNTNIFIFDFLFAIPNGGYRNKSEAFRLKKEGVKKGVSDLFFAFPFNHFFGMWIEVKKPNGILSDEQEDWIKKMIGAGYYADVVRNLDEAMKAFKYYLRMA